MREPESFDQGQDPEGDDESGRAELLPDESAGHLDHWATGGEKSSSSSAEMRAS